MSDNPISPLADLTKPATVLIEKISAAVGGIFKPYQIVRVATAEAEADRIRAEARIEVTDLHRRAMRRFLEEQAKRQSNIEAITHKALPQLAEGSVPERVDDDWITNFFERTRIVSDEQMQQLWSRILAGEANAPGAFSKRTVNLLADLDRSDAELFVGLCGFVWQIGNLVPLIYDVHSDIYNRHSINFRTLGHLEALGLVQFDNLGGFRRLKLPKSLTVHYYGTPVSLTLPRELDNELQLGNVLLTRAGEELAPVSGSRPVEGFFEFVLDRWTRQALVPRMDAEHGTPPNPPPSADSALH